HFGMTRKAPFQRQYQPKESPMKNLSRIALVMFTMAFTLNQAAAQGFQLPNMQVTSEAFETGGIIPVRFTSHGDNVQPDFTITGAPDDTESFAIVFHDIEVALGGSTDDVTHWVAWNIPSPSIPEGSLPEGSVVGNNITGQASYMGSGAPLADRYHLYVFEFYALSENLDLPAGSPRAELMEAMDGKVVAKAAYVGRYARAVE